MTPPLAVRARAHEKVSGIGVLIVSPRRRQLTLARALRTFAGRRGVGFSSTLVATCAVRSSSSGIADSPTSIGSSPPGWSLIVAGTSPGCHPTRPNSTRWNCSGRYLKYARLANLAPDSVEEICRHVRRERRRLGRHPSLLRSFSDTRASLFTV